LNDPVETEALSAFNQPFLEAATATGYPVKPVIQNTVLIGSERDTVLRNSQELKAALNTPSGLERLRRNPMDGCTSVMNMARVASGFNPAQTPEPGRTAEFNARNRAAYVSYLSRLTDAPFFAIALDDTQPISRTTNDWNAVIAQMAALFEGVDRNDFNNIRTSLIQLANVAASHQGQPQSEDLFAQSVLCANAAQNYTLHLYYSIVSMISSTNKGATSTQTNFSIRRTKLTLRASDWPRLAEQVWAKQVTTVVDWLGANNTATGNLQPNLCLK
jgi:hypothetical protein